MNVAAAYPPAREAHASAPAQRATAVARVQVFRDMNAAEPVWRRLEEGDAFATPYQRFDFLAAWQHHAGARDGVTPFIVTGFDRAGAPLFLWPLGQRRRGTLNVVQFLGSKHTNFNVGLWRRDLAAAITGTEIRDIFRSAGKDGESADLVALCSQPLRWDGIANPFALLPCQESVDSSAYVDLPPGDNAAEMIVSASMRARLRKKERKLQKLPGYRYTQATSADEIDRMLESFFALKSVHMAAQGLNNVVAKPGVAQFLREACHRKLANGQPLIELHALEANGEMLALFGAIIDGYRFSSMFNTYTLGENGRHSPGLILLLHMLTNCAQRGVRSFDIGVGRAHYKSFFCKEPEPLFDTFLPLTLRGQVAAPILRAAFSSKRAIKARPALWSVVQTLRRFCAR